MLVITEINDRFVIRSDQTRAVAQLPVMSNEIGFGKAGSVYSSFFNFIHICIMHKMLFIFLVIQINDKSLKYFDLSLLDLLYI